MRVFKFLTIEANLCRFIRYKWQTVECFDPAVSLFAIEVERTGLEIVVYQEPIEPKHSDDCETSSQNAIVSEVERTGLEIVAYQEPIASEVERTGLEIVVYQEPIEHFGDFERSSQSDAALFELQTVREHLTMSDRTSVQPANAEITHNDSDSDSSRTISDISRRLGNISRRPNDDSADEANSAKIVEKKRVKKLSQILKDLKEVEKKSGELKRCPPRKHRSKKIDLCNNPKVKDVKKTRIDEPETSKRGSSSRSVRVSGGANKRPVDCSKVMYCQVNLNPADFSNAERFMRRIKRRQT
ncbi:uncharacterized protein [Rutidosis leptorrhynchoides]|uniref:uncharacterized protein isoform X2 n=1 Tax=Rutidosis leptorrhynchoides TaxID=125765 RepID=UPI003A994E81